MEWKHKLMQVSRFLLSASSGKCQKNGIHVLYRKAVAWARTLEIAEHFSFSDVSIFSVNVQVFIYFLTFPDVSRCFLFEDSKTLLFSLSRPPSFSKLITEECMERLLPAREISRRQIRLERSSEVFMWLFLLCLYVPFLFMYMYMYMYMFAFKHMYMYMFMYMYMYMCIYIYMCICISYLIQYIYIYLKMRERKPASHLPPCLPHGFLPIDLFPMYFSPTGSSLTHVSPTNFHLQIFRKYSCHPHTVHLYILCTHKFSTIIFPPRTFHLYTLRPQIFHYLFPPCAWAP